MAEYKITSESVLEGHPDKVCDQLSDRILDEYLSFDPNAKVAVEAMISNGLLVVAGEVTSTHTVDIEFLARKVLNDIGYTSKFTGFDGKHAPILINVHQQSKDIALGVVGENEHDSLENLGAGDQGIMYGYACDETSAYLPLPIYWAHTLAKRISELRKSNQLNYLLPDGKTQITVQYIDGKPKWITDIVISVQHKEEVSKEQIQKDMKEKVINELIPKHLLSPDVRIFINPTGRFVIGGPAGDTGLTGRKIMVDTYGGVALHGGGAFSGKDASKVDRSAAYMARYVAKNIVAANLAKRCQVALSYAIGVKEPIAIEVSTFHTGRISDEWITAIVKHIFDFSPSGIIETLSLHTPIFAKTAAYGHFKETDDLPWERTDKKELLQCIIEKLS